MCYSKMFYLNGDTILTHYASSAIEYMLMLVRFFLASFLSPVGISIMGKQITEIGIRSEAERSIFNK